MSFLNAEMVGGINSINPSNALQVKLGIKLIHPLRGKGEVNSSWHF